MTKQEAIAAMKSGQRVTHNYFTDSEWVSLTPTGLYQFEDGCVMPSLNFWEDRKGHYWDEGWSIFAISPSIKPTNHE